MIAIASSSPRRVRCHRNATTTLGVIAEQAPFQARTGAEAAITPQLRVGLELHVGHDA
jgi:hypothetical protein